MTCEAWSGITTMRPSVLRKVLTALPADPMEPRGLSHLAQLPAGDQAEARQAATSTRQVPTKSGSGSSGSTVVR